MRMHGKPHGTTIESTYSLPVKGHRNTDIRYDLHLPHETSLGDAAGRPPLVAMIHGLGGTKDSLGVTYGISGLLEQGVAVLNFDNTGLVPLSSPIRANTAHQYPSALLRTMHHVFTHVQKTHAKRVDFDRLVLNGVSFGAIGSALYAAENTKPASERLLPEHPALPVTGIALHAFLGKPLDIFGDELKDALKMRLWRMLHLVQRPIAGEMLSLNYKLYKEFSGIDLVELGQHIHVPVAMFQGDQDAYAPLGLARKFFDNVPHSEKEFHVMQDGGHFFEDQSKIPKGVDPLLHVMNNLDTITKIPHATTTARNYVVNVFTGLQRKSAVSTTLSLEQGFQPQELVAA